MSKQDGQFLMFLSKIGSLSALTQVMSLYLRYNVPLNKSTHTDFMR